MNAKPSRRATARQAACIETTQDYSLVMMVLPARHSTSMGSVRFHQNDSLWSCYDVQGHLRRSWARFAAIRWVSKTQSFCLSQSRFLVGSALRNNPFAPFVPCHRIIASNMYIGGFFGEWGTGANARGGQKNTGLQCNRKMEMLAKEGVTFSVEGYLTDDSQLWIGRG